MGNMVYSCDDCDSHMGKKDLCLDCSKNKRGGIRLDNGKVRMDLVFNDFAIPLYELGKVLTRGAKKYPDSNWQGLNPNKDFQPSLCRHLNSYSRGELIDPETGMSHLVHALFNLMALVHFEEIGK